MGDAVVEVLVSSILRGNRGDGDGRERLGLNGGHLDLEEEKEEKKGGKGGKGGKGRKYKFNRTTCRSTKEEELAGKGEREKQEKK